MLTPLKMSQTVRTCLLAALFGSLLSGSRVRTEETEPRIVHHPSDVVVKVGSPATLSCRVDGSPKPTIEWQRNGQPLVTDKGDGRAVPMALPEGSLFFLNVGVGRRGQTHEGVYACVATNSAGRATSRNASLYIAGEMVEGDAQGS
uniref:Ig-like domain-containing protein n=1 Tax=Poecilia reticulata TaxID=8081 RepID=A0A3P9P9Y1_POERE